MKKLLINRLIILLIRYKLHLKRNEKFKFSNQKSGDIYHFDYDNLIKETRYGTEKSSVSLNFLLSDEVGVRKI